VIWLTIFLKKKKNQTNEVWADSFFYETTHNLKTLSTILIILTATINYFVTITYLDSINFWERDNEERMLSWRDNREIILIFLMNWKRLRCMDKVFFFGRQTKWQSHYKLTHINGGTGVRTPIMASGLTISAFLSVELGFVDCMYKLNWKKKEKS